MDFGFWIFSGDTDAVIPITSTRYSIRALKLPTMGPWRTWYEDGQLRLTISSALTPTVQVHDLAERLLRPLPLVIAAAAAPEEPSKLGVQNAGKRSEICRVWAVASGVAEKEALLAVVEGIETGLQLVPLI
ncbi:hypothetical protein Pfo_022349 [Paulownia fortunei]|nr:hypothetical protein Pfo_022349 [Paulownia fortunei]